MKESRLKITASATLCVILFILLTLLISYGFEAHAWFASNVNASANGMQLALKTDEYKIYIDKTNKYTGVDQEGEENYEGMNSFRGILQSIGLAFNNTDDIMTSSALALELDNEYEYEDKYYLVPGSYGSFTVYLEKLVLNDISVSFNLNFIGYKKGYDENERAYAFIPTDNMQSYNQALNLLKGHILFFESRVVENDVPVKYTDFIDGTYTFNTSSKSPISGGKYDGLYSITLYWEWPLLYNELARDISSENTEKKYPLALALYIENHRNYFFASNINSNILDELDDGYNDGDQIIGDNIHYLVLKLD